MSEFNIRADAVDVEQIMRQIRSRIRDKRGVDYTEEQIQELARVRLEKFLDPKGVRSDLLEQFRRHAETERPSNFEFDDTTLFTSRKPLVAFFRRLLRPVLRLFLNPATTALSMQSRINRHLLEHDALFYELVHNMVVEMTRISIDVKNVQMRVESVSGRLDFNERRARALEAVVQYRPEAAAERIHNAQPVSSHSDSGPSGVDPITGGESLRSRRRRRRRGRRSGPGFVEGTDESRTTNHEPRAQNNELRTQSAERRAQNGEPRTQSDDLRAGSEGLQPATANADDAPPVPRPAPDSAEPHAVSTTSTAGNAEAPEVRATREPASIEPPSDTGSDAS